MFKIWRFHRSVRRRRHREACSVLPPTLCQDVGFPADSWRFDFDLLCRGFQVSDIARTYSLEKARLYTTSAELGKEKEKEQEKQRQREKSDGGCGGWKGRFQQGGEFLLRHFPGDAAARAPQPGSLLQSARRIPACYR